MLHVLIADDDAAIRGLLATILGTSDCSVDLVTNGVEAIRAFADRDYDLVITDLEMPQLDGKELTRSIRQLNPNIPVVMISGCPDASAMALELKEAGVDKLISKPFRIAEILALKSLCTKHEKNGHGHGIRETDLQDSIHLRPNSGPVAMLLKTSGSALP